MKERNTRTKMVRCVACNTGRATFHSFPKDLGMRQKWLANIRDHLVSDITPEKLELWLLHFPVVTNPGIWRVCSRHFEQRCFSERTMTKMMNTASKNIPNLRLCYDAVPTLFTEEEISRKGHMSHLGPAKAPELRKLKPKEPALEHSGVLSDVIQGVPVNTLVNTAVNMPVNTLVNTAVNTPVNTLVNTAVNMPVNTPVNTLVNTAVNMPVNAAVNTLVNTAVNTPVTAAVNMPVNTLVNTAVNTPVNTVGLVNTSVNTLVSSPVNSLNTLVNKLGNIPVNTLVNTPVNTPVNTFILTHSLIGQVQPVQVPVVELSSVSNSNSTEVGRSSPDVPAENLRENLQSQLSRWKGACKALRLTDDQMAKFLLDRYYKGDKSVSAFSGSQSTHKTLLLDRGLLTLWNDSMADKGFSSDKDFLWFLLLGPQKSGTDSEGLTVREHGASDKCVSDKVNYAGPGDTASVTYQESNGAANCPLTLPPTSCNKTNPTQKTSVAETAPVPATSQNFSHADTEAGKDNGEQKHRRKKRRKPVEEEPQKDHPVSNDPANSPKKCRPSPTQKKNISDETAMTAQVPVTSQNDELQSRKQVQEPKKCDPVFPDGLDKDRSHCDNGIHSDTTPTQQVELTESGASAPCTATQKSLHVQRERKPSSKPYAPNRAKKRKYFIPEAWREPSKDMQGMGDCENSTTCSQPTSNTNSTKRAKRRKYRIPEAWREPVKDMNGLSTCVNSTTCSQSTSGEVGVDLKDKDELEIDLNDCNSNITSSQLCSSAVSIPVKQEDDPNHSLSSQLSWGGTVRTKVEKEDEQGMNLCSFDNTNLLNRAKRRKYLVPGPREGPSKYTSNCENSTTCSKYLVPGPMAKPIKDLGDREITTTAPQPSCGEVGNDFLEEDELEIDLNDCDSTTASFQISSGTVCIKQEDGVENNLLKSDNHGTSLQQRWDSSVSIKVEKEDGLEMNLCRFSNTNVSCRQYSTNIIKGNNVGFDNCDYTSTPQLCHDTVSIKVEREDGLEMDFGCCSTGNTITPSETEPSFDTDDIQEEELEMHLKRAILATAEHLG
ncbi:uncharacterized protein LOC144920568 isoform X2 [Branchiostoma floridae x Branchiostoma belcheri]